MSTKGRTRTPFEWTVLVTSVLMIVLVLVGLVVGGLSSKSDPPRLSVRIVGSEAAPGGEAVDVEVENSGGTTAEDVVIEVTAGDVVREATVVAVAKGTSETATVVVPRGAGRGARAEVVSYLPG